MGGSAKTLEGAISPAEKPEDVRGGSRKAPTLDTQKLGTRLFDTYFRGVDSEDPGRSRQIKLSKGGVS